jgi:hypothetical protein
LSPDGKKMSPKVKTGDQLLPHNGDSDGRSAHARKVFMKKVLTRGLMGVAALAVPLGASLALPTAAHASPNTGVVKVVTHSAQHEDTTGITLAPSCGLVDQTYGPVWALDNMSVQVNSTPLGHNQYNVTITDNGSYSAMANPLTGNCWNGSGTVNGTIEYVVTSPTGINPDAVPSQEAPGTHTGQILAQLFGSGYSTSPNSGSYSFTYTNVPGAPNGIYTQVG